MFDIDGVLAEWMGSFTKIAHEWWDTPITQHADNPCWDNLPGMTKLQENSVWDHVKQSKTFWLDVQPMISSQDFARINLLGYSERVYFVTARPGFMVKQQTERWLRRQGVVDPTVIISKFKGEMAKALEADYSIEDKAGNAVYISYQSPKTVSYLIDRPYNHFDPEVMGSRVKRIKTVSEYLDAVLAG